MKKIAMVDLRTQYEKIKDEINDSINNVLQSSAFINGPEVSNFADELAKYLSVKNVIPCANGTDSLQIAMMALGLKPGDEVITVSFTFIATAEVIALLGLKPVFVDVDYDTFNIDISKIESVITPKTKAIVPVHLFGQTANMEEIMKIAKKYNLFVIEDNCQSIGADYYYSDGSVKKAGTIGDVGCTSFFPSKNLGCYGDGGAIFTNDDELAKKIKAIVNHGMVVRYYHDYIGVNSRLDSIQAAILRVKLKYLDNYIANRRKAADFYDNAFKENPKIKIPVRASYSSHVFHQYTVKLENVDRQKLIDYLAEKGIPAMIYYPVPIHLQKAYKSTFGYTKGEFPVTEKLSDTVISLPMHSELDEEQLSYITQNVLDFINNN